MFAEMRRKDRQLSKEETMDLLSRAQYGTLSTAGSDGYPYCVPISYVLHNDKICFHCARGVGSKVRNIQENPKVCFTVVGDTEILPDRFSTKYESAVLFGEARESSGETKRAILESFVGKYSKGFEEIGAEYIGKAFEKVAVYEISIDHITGKARR